MNIYIIGCGDIGRRLGLLHQAAGDAVTALTRSAERQARLRNIGFEAELLDLDQTHATLPVDTMTPELVYMLAPPPAEGDDDPRTRRLLAALSANHATPDCLVYCSTTGVYGDCGGDWVDETRPRNPQTGRARRRAAAEQNAERWAEANQVRLVILRVPGIYGPGRLPLERLNRNLPVLLESDAPWSNRIHADDLAAAAFAAASDRNAGGIYNVSDGQPTTMTDYFNRVADHLGLPRPPQISRDEAEQVFSPGMLSFLRESRRINNHRLLALEGFKLRYPDLDSGLAACLRAA
jgi:nucleoside-diphosphate-sugar epimerase